MDVRPGYKRTEAGIVPNDWSVSCIGALAATGSGTTPPRRLQERYFNNGTIPWVKTLDLNNSEIFETSERVTDLALNETSLKVYPVDTVLVAMYGGFQQIGRTGILRIAAAVNQAITAIEAKRDRLNSGYLLATLNYQVNYWKSVASSSRRDPNITGQNIRDFPVAYPSVPEQRSIATALSDVDALLNGLDRLIAKRRDLKHAAMQQLLTGRTRLPGFHKEWTVSSFDDVLVRLNAKHNQIQTSDYRQSGLYPVVDQGKAAIVGFSDRADKVLKCPTGGVIVFGDHTCIVKYVNFDFLVGADGTQILQGRAGQCTMFHAFQLQYRGIEPTGYNRHFKLLQEHRFLVPPHDEQAAIASVLFDMDTELSAMEGRVAKTRALKQGMMQELLTGRIRLVKLGHAERESAYA